MSVKQQKHINRKLRAIRAIEKKYAYRREPGWQDRNRVKNGGNYVEVLS
jgi:hypothetical protein